MGTSQLEPDGNDGDIGDGNGTDVPERLDEVTTSIEELQDALEGAEDLEQVLKRLADTAVQTVPQTHAVSLTVINGAEVRTAVITDLALLSVEDEQYGSGRGPALAAAEERRPLRVVLDEEARSRWPEFAAAADRAGVRCYLSAPVLLDDGGDTEGELLGALNLYTRDDKAFDPLDEALLRLLTTAASVVIHNGRRYFRFRELAGQLQEALTSRAEIDQAKGVLMAAHGIDADQAFQRLVRESQHTNTKLHTVARRLLASLRAH